MMMAAERFWRDCISWGERILRPLAKLRIQRKVPRNETGASQPQVSRVHLTSRGEVFYLIPSIPCIFRSYQIEDRFTKRGWERDRERKRERERLLFVWNLKFVDEDCSALNYALNYHIWSVSSCVLHIAPDIAEDAHLPRIFKRPQKTSLSPTLLISICHYLSALLLLALKVLCPPTILADYPSNSKDSA